MILVEKIIQLVAFSSGPCRQDSESGKFAVAPKSTSAHDEGVHDQSAHPWQFCEGASQLRGRDLQNLRLLRTNTSAGERGRSLQHGHISDEVSRPGVRQ